MICTGGGSRCAIEGSKGGKGEKRQINKTFNVRAKEREWRGL